MAHDEKNDAHGHEAREAHGHEAREAHGHGAREAHGGSIAHTMAPGMLIGVWGALMVFTVLTVWASQQGLGSQLSFTVAMIIATIKAGLVMSIFMHLWWDKRLNLFVFMGCFLFVILFIGMSLADKSENTNDINRKTADDLAQGAK